MKIKEILTLTAFYLQLEDVLGLPQLKDDYGGAPETGTEAERVLGQLLRCANLVCGEIASDYYPLSAKETVSTADGTISPLALNKRLIDVKRITQAGCPVRFKVYPAAIKTAGGKVEIEYSYLPENYPLDGETDFGDKISARIIAYGTAAEYCLICGLFEEAVVWEKRFKDSMLAAQSKKSEIRVKGRKWH